MTDDISMRLSPDCKSCLAIQGQISLTNTPRLYDGRYWVIEHIYPTEIAGWLVIVLKRHCHGLHQLTGDELDEFNQLMTAVIRAQHAILGTYKEYVVQFAEAPGFDHVHFHIIPRLPEWPDEWRGSKVFSAIGQNLADPLSATKLADLTQKLQTSILRALQQLTSD